MKQRSARRVAVEFLAARVALATLAIGPRGLSEYLARFYVKLLDLVVPRLRRTAFRNLSMAMPEADQKAIVRGSFHSIARVLVAMARFHEITKENVHDWIRYDGLEHFEDSLKRGKGVLFATAHLGNWELSAFAHALMASPMHFVVRALDNPRIDSLVLRLRTLSGNQVIEKRDFARGILRALYNNEAVGILIDQNMSLDDGIFVDFFGIPACVDKSFAKLAARSGAAIIPGFAFWSDQERKYILKFYPPLYASGDLQADTQSIHAQLEAAIREHPEQWLWMHRRWKTRPAGEAPLY